MAFSVNCYECDGLLRSWDLREPGAVDVVLVGNGVFGWIVLAFHVVTMSLNSVHLFDVVRVPWRVEVVELLALLVEVFQVATELQFVDRLQVVITFPPVAKLAWLGNLHCRTTLFLDWLLRMRQTDVVVGVLVLDVVTEADPLYFHKEGPLARPTELPRCKAVATPWESGTRQLGLLFGRPLVSNDEVSRNNSASRGLKAYRTYTFLPCSTFRF